MHVSGSRAALVNNLSFQMLCTTKMTKSYVLGLDSFSNISATNTS